MYIKEGGESCIGRHHEVVANKLVEQNRSSDICVLEVLFVLFFPTA